MNQLNSGELRSFVERLERLEADKQDIAADQKEVMAEAKSRGYDTKIMAVFSKMNFKLILSHQEIKKLLQLKH